jgi:hypothetical protein
MTVNELILLDMSKVRRDSNLMHLYLNFFKETFKYLPNCAGCSFSTDWYKLVSFYSKKEVTLQKQKVMSNTIKIKKAQGKILSYKQNGKTFRLYDNILNDDFINGYLSNGSEEEIAERKKLFIFPIENIELKEVINIEKETIRTISEDNDTSKIEDNSVNTDTFIIKKKRGRKPKNEK